MHPTERFVPLHFYLLHALDLMYDHLRKGKALPPSQVMSAAPHQVEDDAPSARVEHALVLFS
jgi:hydroxybutyrate-dimer hydrolase